MPTTDPVTNPVAALQKRAEEIRAEAYAYWVNAPVGSDVLDLRLVRDLADVLSSVIQLLPTTAGVGGSTNAAEKTMVAVPQGDGEASPTIANVPSAVEWEQTTQPLVAESRTPVKGVSAPPVPSAAPRPITGEDWQQEAFRLYDLVAALRAELADAKMCELHYLAAIARLHSETGE